jgi:hypothetical protein
MREEEKMPREKELEDIIRLQRSTITHLRGRAKDSVSYMKDIFEAIDKKGIPLAPEIGYVLVSPGEKGKIQVISRKAKELTGCCTNSDLVGNPWPELIDRQTLGLEKYTEFIEELNKPVRQEAVLPLTCLNGNGKDVDFIKDPLMKRRVHLGTILIITELQKSKGVKYFVDGLEEAQAEQLYTVLRRLDFKHKG